MRTVWPAVPSLDEIVEIIRPQIHYAEWQGRKYEQWGDSLLKLEAARIRQALVLMVRDDPPGSILEVGLEYAGLAMCLRRIYPAAKICAVEHPSRVYLNDPNYQRLCAAEEIQLIVLDLNTQRLPSSDGEFDLISLGEVLEHLPFESLARIFRELSRVLSPGGSLVLSTPNLVSLKNRLTMGLGHSPFDHPFDRMDETLYHSRLYSLPEVDRLLSESGMRLDEVRWQLWPTLGATRKQRLFEGIQKLLARWRPSLNDRMFVRARSPRRD